MIKRYKSASDRYIELYGEKVYKLALQGGETCPNRDGTCGVGGCIFCGEEGSGEFSEKRNDGLNGELSYDLQIERAKSRIKSKSNCKKFIAYYQSFTSTYTSVERLKKIINPAIADDSIVGLSFATRPDCLPSDILNLLSEVNERKKVFVELGLQTSNDETAKLINRGYDFPVYAEAAEKLKQAGIETLTHVIIGLPGENLQTVMETVKQACKFTDGVKLQLLHVLMGTKLAVMFEKGDFSALSLETYTDCLCELLPIIPKDKTVYRLTGDPPKKSVIAPLWSTDKKRVLNYVNAEFERRNVFQGSNV